MSDLDRELERAIQESEDGAAADSSPAAAIPVAPAAPRRRGSWGLLVGLLVIGGGVLTLVMQSADQAAIYSMPVDKLMSQQSEYSSRNVRVEGTLVKGTLQHRTEPCEYRFSMEKNGQVLPVRYESCVIPDTFRDVPNMDVQVTAEGKLSGEGHFSATTIMAKCPSKYEMENKAASGVAAPHAMPAPLPGE